MLKVQRHGSKTRVRNPATGEWQDMVNIVFVEEGRDGAVGSISNSSKFLDRVLGKQTGLRQLRTHTQPVLASEADDFPIGKEIEGHINRVLYSQPQMRQQQNVVGRMVDGKPTYFITELDQVSKDDRDERVKNETLALINPQILRDAGVGVAEVITLETAPSGARIANTERVSA